MLRWLLGALSRSQDQARLSIVIYHRVLPQPDELLPDEMHAERFDEVCRWLRTWFNVLPLDEACRRLGEGSLPARSLAITFDDGYADNLEVAVPILRRHGLHATFFIATGFLDGGRMWNDTLIESVRRTRLEALDLADLGVEGLGRLPVGTLEERRAAVPQLIRACRYLEPARRDQAVAGVARASGAALPGDLMMTSEQVRAMAASGMGLGGHTVNHPILARLAAPEARREIVDGKQRLESLVQAPVRLFAYPNGRPREDWGAEHADIVRDAGFEAAVTTAWGVSDRRTDRFQLPRFTPWDTRRLAFGVRMARNIGLGPAATRFV